MPLTSEYLRISLMIAKTILACGILIMGHLLYADTMQTVNSSEHKTALLELYTSEGCNSCPPADKWLGTLAENGYLEQQVIPIAFHVDYWDYLGWRDIYADPGYSKRQQRHVHHNRLSTAYTPQLILNGKNLRPSGLLASRLRDINQEKADIHISLRAERSSGKVVEVEATVTGQSDNIVKDSELFIALLTDKIISPVAAGENAGRKLTHHHVTRELLGPFKVHGKQATSIRQQLELPNQATFQESSIVAFVQTSKQEILQAVRLKFD